MRKKEALNYIHIFAGCGGLSLGLYKAGWKGVFAIEKNEMAFQTLKHNLIEKKNHFNWPSWLPLKAYDIEFVLKNHKKELIELRDSVTLVAGGPPCQGFSSAGRRNEDDKRNRLIDSYVEFVKIIKPKIIFFENVKGFTEKFKKRASSGKIYSNYVLKKLSDVGYNVGAKIIDFGDYGIPQRRRRFILVGFLENDPELFFKKLVQRKKCFLKNRDLNENITLKEAISDLERCHGVTNSKDSKGFKQGTYGNIESNYQLFLRNGHNSKYPDSHRFGNHTPNIIKRFNYILENCKKDTDIGPETKKLFNIKKNNVVSLDGNKKSPSLTTLPDDYIHYSEPRIMTVREYARIQSFDDWFEFKGKYTTGGKRRKVEVPRYTQVGNAIPPLFMEQSGEILKMMI